MDLLDTHGGRRTAGSAARTARASTTIPRRARRRCGPASPTCSRSKLDPDTISVDDLKKRFLVAQAIAAAQAMAEGIVTDPREADVGSIVGFGFAPFTGGTLSYIDGMGVGAVRPALRRPVEEVWLALRPARHVLDMAKDHETFYGRFGAKAA